MIQIRSIIRYVFDWEEHAFMKKLYWRTHACTFLESIFNIVVYSNLPAHTKASSIAPDSFQKSLAVFLLVCGLFILLLALSLAWPVFLQNFNLLSKCKIDSYLEMCPTSNSSYMWFNIRTYSIFIYWVQLLCDDLQEEGGFYFTK